MKMDTKHTMPNVFQKMLEDKHSIRECIQSKGDVKQLADERGIKFATPV